MLVGLTPAVVHTLCAAELQGALFSPPVLRRAVNAATGKGLANTFPEP